MKTQVKTIPELRRLKGIKIEEIAKVVARQTYYNMISWKSPNKKTKNKLCELFEIDIATFDKLLKNTIKNNFNS